MRRLLMVFAALVLAAGLAAPAAAHPLPHNDTPLIVNLRPAPGQLLAPGQVTLAALATANRPIERAEIRLDGQALETSNGGSDHATIAATADPAPGRHTVEVIVSTSAGEARRAWSFMVSELEVQRLAGSTRLGTAIAISKDAYPQLASAGSVVLARADDFPDALAAAPLAAEHDAPVLLTFPDELHDAVADELRRVAPPLSTVYLIGHLSDAVEREVREMGFQVERIAGPDDYATAAAVARTVSPANTLIVASGESFADTLSVSSPAADRGFPIVLTRPDALPDATRAVIQEGEYVTVFVVGGRNAVSQAVLDEVQSLVPDAEVVRLSGPGRYDTAAAVARTFFPEYDTVAVANGERFPDALAGGPHAAAHGAPLLLVPAGEALPPQREQVSTHATPRAFVYGGSAVVGGGALADLHDAFTDAGGPQITSFSPGSREVQSLDEIVIDFDRELDTANSSVYVTVAGHEVAGSVTAGDFPRTLVFTASRVPDMLQTGQRYPVVVTIAATDGQTWQHAHRDLTLFKPVLTLTRGDRGPQVADLQQRLLNAGYWVAAVDGTYGWTTQQAVMALQKVHGLARDGVYGPNTRRVLESSPARPNPRTSSGLVVEVDKARQVVLIVSNGHVAHIFNSSTGTGQPYEYDGRTYIASTPSGSFRIGRQIDGWRESHLGRLWRPKYFNGGIALHGSTSVPAYPASHGCVRVSVPGMNFLWDRLPIGTRVLVY